MEHSYKELFTALAKAQAEMEVAGLTKNNPFFKSQYADLTEVIRSSRPYLAKHGLSVIQPIITDVNGTMLLRTMLCHSSGEYIASEVKIIPSKNDVHSLGSAITYLRRYSYISLVGVCAGEDDDGNAASGNYHDKKKEYNYQNYKQKELSKPYKAVEAVEVETVEDDEIVQENSKPEPRISVDQTLELIAEIGNFHHLGLEIASKLKIDAISQIPLRLFDRVMKYVKDEKQKLSNTTPTNE